MAPGWAIPTPLDLVFDMFAAWPSKTLPARPRRGGRRRARLHHRQPSSTSRFAFLAVDEAGRRPEGPGRTHHAALAANACHLDRLSVVTRAMLASARRRRRRPRRGSPAASWRSASPSTVSGSSSFEIGVGRHEPRASSTKSSAADTRRSSIGWINCARGPNREAKKRFCLRPPAMLGGRRRSGPRRASSATKRPRVRIGGRLSMARAVDVPERRMPSPRPARSASASSGTSPLPGAPWSPPDHPTTRTRAAHRSAAASRAPLRGWKAARSPRPGTTASSRRRRARQATVDVELRGRLHVAGSSDYRCAREGRTPWRRATGPAAAANSR